MNRHIYSENGGVTYRYKKNLSVTENSLSAVLAVRKGGIGCQGVVTVPASFIGEIFEYCISSREVNINTDLATSPLCAVSAPGTMQARATTRS